jgi:hypothetical protein
VLPEDFIFVISNGKENPRRSAEFDRLATNYPASLLVFLLSVACRFVERGFLSTRILRQNRP